MAPFDLGTVEELPRPAWRKLNLDTGSARTVFPTNEADGEDIAGGGTLRFKTATGEITESEGGYKVKGKSENGITVSFSGVKAPIHKPLISAGAVTDKGSDIFLSDSLGKHFPSGMVIVKGSPLAKALREWLHWAVPRFGPRCTIPVHKERGVYNVYIKTVSTETDAKSLCPVLVTGGAAASTGKGFPRHGLRHP